MHLPGTVFCDIFRDVGAPTEVADIRQGASGSRARRVRTGCHEIWREKASGRFTAICKEFPPLARATVI